MDFMKSLILAALAATLSVPCARAQEAPAVKAVYILPMASGLDQYLAFRLTEGGVLQVVTDPQKADAILTDRIGGHFLETFKDLFGPKTDDAKAGKYQAGDEDSFHPAMRPLSSSRGAIFLVERATGNVVWSTFEIPKNTQPQELNRTAEKIVDRLAKAQKGKS
jgi:hypothetical protein